MNKEAQLISLLHEVLKVANHLVSHRKHSGSKNGNTGHSGIFAHQSKYNPYRAYTWDKGLQKTIYLGAFSSIQKAKKAQQDYRAGRRVTAGNGRVLQLVKAA